MPDFIHSFSDSNENGVEFVVADLDAALTFMEVAETSGIQETIDRNHENAHHAYVTVLSLLQRLKPNAQQSRAIDGKIAVLKKRLEAVGYQL